MFSLKNKMWAMWDGKHTNYFEGESMCTYETAKEHAYGIISSGIHMKLVSAFWWLHKAFTLFSRKEGKLRKHAQNEEA